MASKPKTKTFILLHRGQAHHGGYTVLGRYKVGARNPKEAEQFLREVIGKHVKIQVYYEDKKVKLTHGEVVKEC